jgi:predicted dehydrogenase/nucleoside-diphosphate-sugar epimerase
MPKSEAKTRVALIGAGFIAQVHLQVMRRCAHAEIVAVCDADLGRAQSLARQHGIEQVFGSVSDLLRAHCVDAAHILVPPDRHFEVAEQCLRGGLSILVEKPMVTSLEDARRLRELAEERRLSLGVNHNMVFHPLHLRLRRELLRGSIGRLEQVSILHSVPLRQLDSGDVGHYMFRAPANILYEQGVHLFSQVVDLLGACRRVEAKTGKPRVLPHGAEFWETWSILMHCERGTAQVSMAFGRKYTESSLLALGTDGEMRLDFARNTSQLLRRSRWPEFFDRSLADWRCAWQGIRQGIGKVFAYAGDLLGFGGPRDPFLKCMGLSLDQFHRALHSGSLLPCDARQGEQVLKVCELAAESAGTSTEEFQSEELPNPGPARTSEILITGGTGLIGKSLVPLLLEEGHPITLLIRKPHLLSRDLRDERIRFFVGDAGDPQILSQAMQGVSQVLHMATCAGEDAAKVEETMANAATAVGEACQKAEVQRLVFISSTAALYLGGGSPVKGDCGTDPKPAGRAAYARGKIAAEEALRGLATSEGLPLVVLRPAIVVGKGAMPEHSGLGLWVSDNHCVGWGSGRLSLPFLLVEDCAKAIAATLDAKDIDGRTYNLSGDVRPSAREYLRALSASTGRAYRFHPQPLWVMYLVEWAKLAVKLLARRKGAPPNMRDFKSRAFRAELDCSDAKQDLNWQPEEDALRFQRAAIEVHAPRSDRGP